MTNEQLATALTRATEVGRAHFGTIGDISCDVEVGQSLTIGDVCGCVNHSSFTGRSRVPTSCIDPLGPLLQAPTILSTFSSSECDYHVY
jgi:hypothetical protein